MKYCCSSGSDDGSGIGAAVSSQHWLLRVLLVTFNLLQKLGTGAGGLLRVSSKKSKKSKSIVDLLI